MTDVRKCSMAGEIKGRKIDGISMVISNSEVAILRHYCGTKMQNRMHEVDIFLSMKRK